ncbi:E3 ubiquitin-protein ligase parkin [Takifugu flavidus]|nr:E3 ubiquitin-protein ligase parkin [Takifugu flavidus]
MIVFVRYNLGPEVVVELQEEATVAELKEVVGQQQGVQPDLLRVLFAGRELKSTSTLQGCDLPEQSTVHIIVPSPASSSYKTLLLPEHLSQGEEENHDSLTRLDLSASRLPTTSSTLGVILERNDSEGVGATAGGGGGGAEAALGGDSAVLQSAGAKDHSVRPRSTFFVYCKSCKLVQPGKLRVRCRSCRQATLTLSRGPSCWDDVLLQSRVHGVCHSDGCHGTEAEFYMKCASHPTSDNDHSVALDLIMTNSRDVPCIACTDVMDVVLVFECLARHVICLECFRHYCQVRLNERQFVYDPAVGYSLPCAAGCINSLIKEVHHFRILGEHQYDRYLQYGAEECLLRSGGLMCPSPGCGAGLVPPDDSRRVECDRQIGCGFVFCRICREGYHEGGCLATQSQTTAEGSQDFVVDEGASLRGRWDQASLLLLQESTKPCPKCSAPVERNGGCMHMLCPLCKAEWCWLCGVFWNRECMGDHWFG